MKTNRNWESQNYSALNFTVCAAAQVPLLLYQGLPA
jgi:hypothetical protein